MDKLSFTIEYNIEYKQMLLIWNRLTINPDDYLCQGGIDPARIVQRSLPDSVCNPCLRLQVTHPIPLPHYHPHRPLLQATL